MPKPAFDPSQPFQEVASASKPKFDPSKPFQPVADAPKDATFGERAMAVPTAMNEGTANALGFPVDIATDAIDLAKAGAGYVQSKFTGKPPSEMFDPSNRENVVGSSAYLKNKANKAGIATEAPRPDDSISNAIHSAVSGGTTALLTAGRGGAAAPLRTAVAGGASNLASQVVGSETGDPALQTLASLAAGHAAGSTAKPSAPKLTPPPAAETPAEVARAAGFKLNPAATQQPTGKPIGGVVGRSAEAVSNPTKLATGLEQYNQQNANNLATKALGVPEGTMLNTKTFEKLKSNENKAYEALASKLGPMEPDAQLASDIKAAGGDSVSRVDIDPAIEKVRGAFEKIRPQDAQSVVNEVRILRKQSAANLNTVNDAQKNMLGKVQRDIADSMDDWIDRTGSARGLTNEVQAYRDARVNLAKIHTVEAATRGGAVNIQDMYKNADKGKRSPLTGELALIAHAGEHFPDITGVPNANSTLTVQPETFFGTMKKAIAAPLQAAVRAGLKSDTYQNTLGKKADSLGPTSTVGSFYRPPAAKGQGPAPGGNGPGPGGQPPSGPPSPGDLSLVHELQLAPDELQLHDPNPVPAKFKNQDTSGLHLQPELSLADELSLAHNTPHSPTPTPTTPGPSSSTKPKIVEAPGKPGWFDIKTGNESPAVRVQGEENARSLAADLLDEPAPTTAPTPKKRSLADELTSLEEYAKTQKPATRGSTVSNNASGESSASMEAISRSKQEKAAGQDRFLIDKDGTVTPLVGVDAVDAAARPGQVIVQRGIGKDEYTILDRGGLSKAAANGHMNGAMESIKGLRRKTG